MIFFYRFSFPILPLSTGTKSPIQRSLWGDRLRARLSFEGILNKKLVTTLLGNKFFESFFLPRPFLNSGKSRNIHFRHM